MFKKHKLSQYNKEMKKRKYHDEQTDYLFSQASGEQDSLNKDDQVCHISDEEMQSISLTRSSNIKDLKFRFYEVDCNTVLAALQSGTAIYFYGSLCVRCISGCVEIFGYKVQKDHEINVVSRFGCSSMYIRTDQASCIDENATEIISNYLTDTEEINNLLNFIQPNGALFLLNNYKKWSVSQWKTTLLHSDVQITSINSMDDYILKFKSVERKLKCLIESDEDHKITNKLTVCENWQNTAMTIKNCSNGTLICGGQNVGKSTFTKYLINDALNSCAKVLFVDLDIGQCEISLPGCITVTLIEKPLLGFFTSRKTLMTLYIGEIDVSRCFQNYVEALTKLVNFVNENYSDIPYYINTMGFSRGLGISLIASISRLFQPKFLIQIDSKFEKDNFPHKLTSGYINKLPEGVSKEQTVNFQTIVLNSWERPKKTNQSLAFALTNKSWRSIRYYLYFNNTSVREFKVDDFESSVTINEKSKLSVSEQLENIFRLGNLVTFGKLTDHSEKFIDAIGFGYIKKYDKDNNTIYIDIPDFIIEDLDSVKFKMFISQLEIPDKVILNYICNNQNGLIPFTSKTQTTNYNMPFQRKFRWLF